MYEVGNWPASICGLQEAPVIVGQADAKQSLDSCEFASAERVARITDHHAHSHRPRVPVCPRASRGTGIPVRLPVLRASCELHNFTAPRLDLEHLLCGSVLEEI